MEKRRKKKWWDIPAFGAVSENDRDMALWHLLASSYQAEETLAEISLCDAAVFWNMLAAWWLKVDGINKGHCSGFKSKLQGKIVSVFCYRAIFKKVHKFYLVFPFFLILLISCSWYDIERAFLFGMALEIKTREFTRMLHLKYLQEPICHSDYRAGGYNLTGIIRIYLLDWGEGIEYFWENKSDQVTDFWEKVVGWIWEEETEWENIFWNIKLLRGEDF